MIDLDTWIISDTHFGHEAITRMCNRPADVDGLMSRNWSVVQPGDTVLHLGDIMTWKDKENPQVWQGILSQFPGVKMFVRGNHDRFVPGDWTEVGDVLGQFVEEDVRKDGVPYRNDITNHGFYAEMIRPGHIYGKRILFSHYPDAWLLDWDINIHGHIHNNPRSPKLSSARDYRNVSVEVMDYRPTRLRDILS